MTTPIRPDEINGTKLHSIPSQVIEAFNELITQKYNEGRAVVKQDDVIRLIQIKMGRSRENIFSEGLLNVEGIFREAGWKVEYDKPGYNETYPATFTFSKGK